jgi:hypothetical protein
MKAFAGALMALFLCGPALATAGEAATAAPKVHVLLVTGHQNTERAGRALFDFVKSGKGVVSMARPFLIGLFTRGTEWAATGQVTVPLPPLALR